MEQRDLAEEEKARGNDKFGHGDWTGALEHYGKALELCPPEFQEERATYFANRAASQMKLENWKDAIEDCTEAIACGPKNNKALLRRAICYTKDEKDCDKALEDYKKLAELEPQTRNHQKEISRLEAQIAERNEKLKDEMLGQMKNLGNMFRLSTDNFQLEPQAGGGYSVNMKKS
ncbi:hypothetical protein L596_027234 [Steinernema carpocapsae]|uniref:Uncharacterized protein n=1 Tax=Steinernema carpocapsae TaxID=34508 RepID=A0A4U5M3Q0_STECR|nr:hypothetical protein L596_027234 [Steinernema carpocapsae]